MASKLLKFDRYCSRCKQNCLTEGGWKQCCPKCKKRMIGPLGWQWKCEECNIIMSID